MALIFVTKIISRTTSHLSMAAVMVVTMYRLRVRWLPPRLNVMYPHSQLAIGYSELHIFARFSHGPKQTRLLRACPCRSAAQYTLVRVRLKRDGTRTETSFRLSAKRTSQFKSAGASVQSTAGSRGVRISVCNAGYTTFQGSVRVLATHSIRHFPLHFPSRASPCAIRFQKRST
jgi:hypothetical protein